jgi:hypothetical protein
MDVEEEVPRMRKGRRNLWAPDVFIHTLGPSPKERPRMLGAAQAITNLCTVTEARKFRPRILDTLQKW